jgi:hypothetical protein
MSLLGGKGDLSPIQ